MKNARQLRFNSRAEFDNWWSGDDHASLHASGWTVYDIVFVDADPGTSPDGTHIHVLLLPPLPTPVKPDVVQVDEKGLAELKRIANGAGLFGVAGGLVISVVAALLSGLPSC